MKPLMSHLIAKGKTFLLDLWKTLASLRMFFILSPVLIVAFILGTLIPQNDLPAHYLKRFGDWGYQLLLALGLTDLYHSAWFIALLVLLGLNTSACLWTRLSRTEWKQLPWGAVLSHLGMLLILAGGVVRGIWGVQGTLPLQEGQIANAMLDKGKHIPLPFEVMLGRFSIERYDKGRHFLRVTHTQEGWQEVVEVQPGSSQKVKGVAIAVLKYLPDFAIDDQGRAGTRSEEPNNPALLVEVTASPARRHWLFAKHPGAHTNKQEDPYVEYGYLEGKIKQFRSELVMLEKSRVLAEGNTEVNRPFKFNGYTFYQSGYDPDNPRFSSIQVSKDPSVPIVYAGFGILSLGLIWSFVRRPKP